MNFFFGSRRHGLLIVELDDDLSADVNSKNASLQALFSFISHTSDRAKCAVDQLHLLVNEILCYLVLLSHSNGFQPMASSSAM